MGAYQGSRALSSQRPRLPPLAAPPASRPAPTPPKIDYYTQTCFSVSSCSGRFACPHVDARVVRASRAWPSSCPRAKESQQSRSRASLRPVLVVTGGPLSPSVLVVVHIVPGGPPATVVITGAAGGTRAHHAVHAHAGRRRCDGLASAPRRVASDDRVRRRRRDLLFDVRAPVRLRPRGVSVRTQPEPAARRPLHDGEDGVSIDVRKPPLDDDE